MAKTLTEQFKETLYNITGEKEIKEFLDFCRETQRDMMASNFDYTIIDLKDIPTILETHGKNAGFINIQINHSNYIDTSCNPIIFWLFDCGEHVNIYDLANLKGDIIKYAWLTEDEKEEIINRFQYTQVISKITKIQDYQDIELTQKIIKCINEIYIDNQFEDFKYIVQEWNDEIYIISFYDTYDPEILVWSDFCKEIIELIKEYPKLNWNKLLELLRGE